MPPTLSTVPKPIPCVLDREVVHELDIPTFKTHRQLMFDSDEVHHIDGFRLRFGKMWNVRAPWGCRRTCYRTAGKAESRAFVCKIEE